MKKSTLLFVLICSIVFMGNAQTNRFIFAKNNNRNEKAEKNISHYVVPTKSIEENNLIGLEAAKTNFLKANKANNATLTALFNRPVGTYIPSMIGNEDNSYLGYSYNYPGYFGSAYSIPWTFRNLSTGATSYSWDWGTSVGYSTVQNLVLKLDNYDFMSDGSYYSPVLYAFNGAAKDTFKLSDNKHVATLYSSSASMYVGNADYYANSSYANSYGNSIWYLKASGSTSLDGSGVGYFWGSCKRAADGTNGTKLKAIYSFYEKPMSPLVIKDICYFGVDANKKGTVVPASKSLSVAVIKLDATGNLTTDTIAKSSIIGSDIIEDTYNNVFLPFTFSEIDPETGRESPLTLVVQDAFVIVLSGFEQDGVDFGLLSDYQNAVENTSYFSKVDASTGISDGKLYKSGTNMNIYLTMNSYFNYLWTPVTELTAPVAGGSAVDASNEAGAVVYSYFNIENKDTGDSTVWIDPETRPDWLTITCDTSNYTSNGALVYDFNAKALPAGLNGRSTTIKIKSLGAQASVKVTQGDITGTTNPMASKVKVAKTLSSYEISNIDNCTSVSLMEVSGQVIGTYQIKDNAVSVPTAILSNGVYLLKFNGASNSSFILKLTK